MSRLTLLALLFFHVFWDVCAQVDFWKETIYFRPPTRLKDGNSSTVFGEFQSGELVVFS
jgi:hypothetical protein